MSGIKNNLLVLGVGLLAFSLMAVLPMMVGAQITEVEENIDSILVDEMFVDEEVPVDDLLISFEDEEGVESDSLLTQTGSVVFSWWGLLVVVLIALVLIVYLIIRIRKNRGENGISNIDEMNQVGNNNNNNIDEALEEEDYPKENLESETLGNEEESDALEEEKKNDDLLR